MLETVVQSFRNRWTGKPFGYPGEATTTLDFHSIDVWVQTAAVDDIEELVAFEVQQPLLVNITPVLPEDHEWAHGEHYVLSQATGEAWLAEDVVEDYEPEEFEWGQDWSEAVRYKAPKQPIHDDVPPLDNQPSNGFPSPYPTPFTYEQKQPKFGSRVLLFDEEDNEWLCVQLASVNNKITWTVDNYHCWIIEPKPTDRWLPFPPAP